MTCTVQKLSSAKPQKKQQKLFLMFRVDGRFKKKKKKKSDNEMTWRLLTQKVSLVFAHSGIKSLFIYLQCNRALCTNSSVRFTFCRAEQRHSVTSRTSKAPFHSGQRFPEGARPRSASITHSSRLLLGRETEAKAHSEAAANR